MSVHDDSDDPGVPEALPRALGELAGALGAASIDCLWIFPPLVRGRREWGLAAAGCFEARGARRLVTVRYEACRNGRGLHLDCRLADQGVAPRDRLPRVMAGVVRRGPSPLGDPRLVEVGGDARAWDDLMKEYPAGLFEESVAGPPPPAEDRRGVARSRARHGPAALRP